MSLQSLRIYCIYMRRTARRNHTFYEKYFPPGFNRTDVGYGEEPRREKPTNYIQTCHKLNKSKNIAFLVDSQAPANEGDRPKNIPTRMTSSERR